MKKVIITSVLTLSEPFTIDNGETLSLQANGLQGTDYTIVEMVQTTKGKAASSECCPSSVVLPEIASTHPLRCPNGARYIMTQRHPWLEITAPRGMELRVRVVADPVSVVTVEADFHHYGPTCASCACVEPWCPSHYLSAGSCRDGYAFAVSDQRDPEATVAYVSESGDTVYLFPTARPGATVPIKNTANVVLGYISNKSTCA